MADASTTTLSILIVDDDKTTRALLHRLLAGVPGWTLRIDDASDGEGALQSLKDVFYDLVLLDYRLPGETGLDVLDKIRQFHKKSAVVMITSAGSEQVAVAAMKKGAMDYLTRDELLHTDLPQLFRRLLEVRDLVNQNMELKQINEMKNEFIANVSHELRTPLSVVIGYGKTLRAGNLGPLSEPQAKAVDSIIERGESLLETLNRILEFRAAAERQLQAVLKPLDLNSWLATYAQRPHKELEQKGMLLTPELPGKEVWVLAEQTKLTEALDNLVSNAVKFGPEGSRVGLTLGVNGKDARISVVDEGPGIAPEVMPHIFERFFAAGRAATREYPGLGLGLPISQQIAILHNGRIWLESKGAGTGCKAHLSIPLADKRAVERLVPKTAAMEKKRILIVEDNPDLVDVIRLFLGTLSRNLDLMTAESGFEALKCVKEHVPDLIILDVMMPGMDGIEVIQRLRRSPDTENIPVMILTGYEDGAQRALKAGAKDVLLKPFVKETFVTKVAELLKAGRPSSGLQKPAQS